MKPGAGSVAAPDFSLLPCSMRSNAYYALFLLSTLLLILRIPQNKFSTQKDKELEASVALFDVMGTKRCDLPCMSCYVAPYRHHLSPKVSPVCVNPSDVVYLPLCVACVKGHLRIISGSGPVLRGSSRVHVSVWIYLFPGPLREKLLIQTHSVSEPWGQGSLGALLPLIEGGWWDWLHSQPQTL